MKNKKETKKNNKKSYLNHSHDHLEVLVKQNDVDCPTLYNIVQVNQLFV